MWWRPAWFSLKGKVGIRDQNRGKLPTPPRSSVPTNQPIHATQSRITLDRGERAHEQAVGRGAPFGLDPHGGSRIAIVARQGDGHDRPPPHRSPGLSSVAPG